MDERDRGCAEDSHVTDVPRDGVDYRNGRSIAGTREKPIDRSIDRPEERARAHVLNRNGDWFVPVISDLWTYVRMYLRP